MLEDDTVRSPWRIAPFACLVLLLCPAAAAALETRPPRGEVLGPYHGLSEDGARAEWYHVPYETGQLNFVDEAVARGFPLKYFTHDVERQDLTDDGLRDLVFAMKQNAKNILLVNTGGGYFTDESQLLPDLPEVEWSQDVPACDLDGDGRMELLYGNGDISNDFLQCNVVLTHDPVTFEFYVAQDYGLDFEYIEDLTEGILCRDLDADGQTDWLLVVNTDQPSWFYVGL